MFDVIKIDPHIFRDFIEDTESNFNYINSLLKDRTLTEKQVVTKLFQNIHAIKSNAIILGLEHLGEKFHTLEDSIKTVTDKDTVSVDDVISLTIKMEVLMQEMDSYSAITKKINAYRTTYGMDAIFVNSITKAVERLSGEVDKKVEVKAGFVDLGILESKLRKPIKDILFQCVRNSIYHGIEPADERIKKNKSPNGLLVFSIKNIDGNAEVIFSDDGAGLNWEKIRKKYMEKHPEAKNVDKKVLLGSIFKPEFSTVDEPSEAVSIHAGRGVGLSLVKDLVKENQGTINVNSTESGLTFKFTFPLAG
jgi:chemotaxis protein histidine kinase CheA